jgi:hypothetical protein
MHRHSVVQSLAILSNMLQTSAERCRDHRAQGDKILGRVIAVVHSRNPVPP